MMCHKIGRLPISAIGLGRTSLTSRKRMPRPPHRIATFIFNEDTEYLTWYSITNGISKNAARGCCRKTGGSLDNPRFELVSEPPPELLARSQRPPIHRQGRKRGPRLEWG